MKRILLLVSSAIVIFGCNKAPEQTTSTVSATTATQSAPAPSTTSATPAPVPASAPAPAPQPSAGALATQETNWKGVTAEVTEFRRKGNTLTAKVRFSSQAEATPDIVYSEVYLIDTAGGKKYQVLQDEKKAYIAALRQGFENRWFEYLKPGQSQVIWIKFPAPPPEVKSITLQLPNTPPFEDLTIQE